MQEQFFSVTHATPVNVIPMPADFHLPSLEELDAELPEPFRISSAITSIESGDHSTAAQPERVDARSDRDRQSAVPQDST